MYSYIMPAHTLPSTFKPATSKCFHVLCLVNPDTCFEVIGDVNMHHRESNMNKF